MPNKKVHIKQCSTVIPTSFMWRQGTVVLHLSLVQPEVTFCAGSNTNRNISEVRNGDRTRLKTCVKRK